MDNFILLLALANHPDDPVIWTVSYCSQFQDFFFFLYSLTWGKKKQSQDQKVTASP